MEGDVGTWPQGTVEQRVEHALAEVRPALQADGGDVRLLAVTDDVVQIHLEGACDGCPMAHSTLADFVVERIKLYAPEIDRVETA